MNNNFDDNNTQNSNDTYRATQNLNTAIENPQINIDNVNSINMKDVGFDNMATANNPEINNNSPINNNFDNAMNTVNSNNNNISNNELNNNQQQEPQLESEKNITYEPTTNSNANYSYEPVTSAKKRTDENAISNLIHSKEFKVTIFIIFILVIFLLVMPYIYDFIRNLQM